jgi:cell division protein FtsQ
MALWQHNKKIHVVDQSGKVLSGVSAKDYNDIPIIIGLNAPDNLSKLLNDLEACPDLLPRITSATWVGNRRWNLSLGKNLTLLLPEQDVQDALKRFKRYEKQHKISVNVLQKIDLRLKNRLIID